MQTVLWLLVFAVSSKLLFGSETQCGVGEECIYKQWMSWQPCTGRCGVEAQIRQRVFCCPGSLMNISAALRTLQLCTRTCKAPKYYLTEGRHCRKCINHGVLNYTARTCSCPKTYKGLCCQENIKCSDLPCKHGVCYDTTAGFRCDCESGYSGIDCSEDIAEELELPIWLPKLEIALLAVISMTILMTMGCLCLRCCKLCGCSSSDDDDEEEERRKAKPRKNHSQIPKSKSGKSFDF